MIRRLTLLAVLFAALLSCLAATPAGTAAAARQETRLAIRSMTPDVPRKLTDPIRISGTLTNRGTAPLQGVTVRLRFSPQRFTSRQELEAYQSGQLGTARDQGWGAGAVVLPSVLQPGGSVSWQIQVTPANLQVFQFGVYPLSVEALVGGVQIDIWRSFLTYAPAEQTPRVKTRLAFALPVVDEPHRADDATFLDEDLRKSLAAKGRLADLLEVARSAPESVTWFVDPGLLDDVRAMTQPYEVRLKGGREERRDRDPQAAAWLAALAEALAGSQVVALPYADPDVVALAHNGLDEQPGEALATGTATAKAVLNRSTVGSAVYWPVGGLLDMDALDLLAVSGVRTVLLAPQNVPPVQPVATPDAATTLDTVNGPVTALVADETLSRMLDPGVSSVATRQRFIAETAIISAGQVTPKSVVVAPQRRWNPNPQHVVSLLKTAGALPWVSMTQLGSVKPAKNATPRGTLTYTDANWQAELGKDYLGKVKKVAADARLTRLIAPSLTQSGFEKAVLRLTSAGWRRRPAAAESARKLVDGRVQDVLEEVGITGTDRVRTLAGTDGLVPISVHNARDVDVSLQLIVRPDGENLVIEDYPRTLTIGARQSGTVQVPMKMRTSGDAGVTVQLKTAGGEPYGKPIKLRIRTTGYTGIALFIVGGALSVMMAAVVMRVLRRRSQKRVARTEKARETQRV
ncbi:DUF6049 family protein [Thermoactinospora rubra]|uniref:DUF6049 family protein n=1 Tax=Thermoactinospora rubra TaxID=1088767 RepID=UPI00117C1251|nr:DUF6049 family protein [Thermoactinospora rubra]